MRRDSSKRITVIMFIGLLIEVALESMLHYKMIFVWDDLWYATNLATGEPVTGLADIWESQCWHFMNWGGRSVIHGLLQLVIMGGNFFADALNMIVTVLLAYLICTLLGKVSMKYFCLSFFMLIALNPNILLSMFWQSGSVNYLYSSTWILFFIMLYIRQVKEPDAKGFIGINIWIVPLGVATGWSNENMGPATFLLTVMTLVYFMKGLKRKPPVWMWIGAVTTLAGSIPVVAAPGNFVRSSLIKKASLWDFFWDKFMMMLTAGADFLFPVVFFLLVFLLLYFRSGKRLEAHQIIVLVTAILAYGAMVLSPTFPNRATFGIMVLCLTLLVSFLQGIEEADEHCGKCINWFCACMWSISVYMLVIEIKAPL